MKSILALAVVTALPLCGIVSAAAPKAPVIDKVVPLEKDPVQKTAGVFFFDDLEKETDLKKSYQDTGLKSGRFTVNGKDAFSGKMGLEMDYLPKEQMEGDPGSAGWVWRMFGDCPKTSRIPADQKKKYTVAVARWYHKFPEGFQPRDGNHWPPKMARMRCFKREGWSSYYTFLYWIGGKDGHISLERHTKAPGHSREWLPNYSTNFKFSDPVNQGRWIHFEMRIELSPKPKDDKWQGWADGILIGEATNDDLSGTFSDLGLHAMSWDTYWNGGSPKRQSRFYDDLSLSTKPMGPARTPVNPEIITGAFRGDAGDSLAAWEVEIGTAEQKPLVTTKRYSNIPSACEPYEFDRETVWKGSVNSADKSLVVNAKTGTFKGPLEGKAALEANTFYMGRIRHRAKSGEWSEWSKWHAGFATDWAPDTPDDQKKAPQGYFLGQAADGK